jgi:tetratricopeptide (TPR) repeat protein
MGFGIKDNINLDLTYNEIIKPCIIENDLTPFPLYAENRFNAYRCDEISGIACIDYKFVTCLNGADIVIADISTMNVNAIYELGARHALKPRSTILLCAKEKSQNFNFFDLTYVPIVFYNHEGLTINNEVVANTKNTLNKLIDFAINSNSTLPDNPISRALLEAQNIYKSDLPLPDNSYKLYIKGKEKLDQNNYKDAESIFEMLYQKYPTEQNLLLYSLAKYKLAEQNNSYKELVNCINLITSNIDINNSTSETVFGRLAAICLRVFNITKDNEYFYLSLEYYRRGSSFSSVNLYCPRNYCALLLRISEITDDINVIREYYYTAKHYSKLFLNLEMSAIKNGDYEQRIYYFTNSNDLRSIVKGNYINYHEIIERLANDKEISKRQIETIKKGITLLKNSIETIEERIRFF